MKQVEVGFSGLDSLLRVEGEAGGSWVLWVGFCGEG